MTLNSWSSCHLPGAGMSGLDYHTGFYRLLMSIQHLLPKVHAVLPEFLSCLGTGSVCSHLLNTSK